MVWEVVSLNRCSPIRANYFQRYVPVFDSDDDGALLSSSSTSTTDKNEKMMKMKMKLYTMVDVMRILAGKDLVFVGDSVMAQVGR